MTMTQLTPEAIFVPIDLEASLGKIDDCDMQEMESDPVSQRTRTCDGVPSTVECFNREKRAMAPYPFSQTASELKEREKLTQNVGYIFDIQGQPEGLKPEDWTMIDTQMDMVPEDDDFSITSHDAASLAEENFSLEEISENLASFWEEGASPTTQQWPVPCQVSVGSMNDSILGL
jgi:small-conductance mechanosensitive channel